MKLQTIVYILVVTNLVLLLTNHVLANTYETCRGTECRRYDVYRPEKRGRFLIAPTKESQDKVKTGELYEGDKLPDSLKQVSRVADDLRWSDIRVGQCYYDPQNPSSFYKVIKKDSKARMFNYVIEALDHNNSLKLNFLFFRSAESTTFKKLRKLSCTRTPHLSDDRYLRNCIGKRTTGTLLCDFDPQF